MPPGQQLVEALDLGRALVGRGHLLHLLLVGAMGDTNVVGRPAQHLLAAGGEVVGPPLGVEAAGGVAGHAPQQLLGHGRRQHPQQVGVAERGVGEVDRPQVGPLLGQPRADQRQVVVLDQDDGALLGLVDDGPGEGVVDVAVGGPRLQPPAVEAGPAGQVEQAVVEEPQGGVGHHVVGHAVGVGVDGEGVDLEALGVDHAAGRRLPVLVGHGRRDPRGPDVAHHRPEARHQAPAAPAGDQLAVVVAGEGERAPVGNEDDRRVGVAHAPR